MSPILLWSQNKQLRRNKVDINNVLKKDKKTFTNDFIKNLVQSRNKCDLPKLHQICLIIHHPHLLQNQETNMALIHNFMHHNKSNNCTSHITHHNYLKQLKLHNLSTLSQHSPPCVTIPPPQVHQCAANPSSWSNFYIFLFFFLSNKQCLINVGISLGRLEKKIKALVLMGCQLPALSRISESNACACHLQKECTIMQSGFLVLICQMKVA